jgi:peptidase E
VVVAAPRQIVAAGGGGFAFDEDARLDRYALEATGRARPRALWLGTASGDAPEYAARFEAAYRTLGAETDVLAASDEGAADRIAEADLVVVGGGNTLALLEAWRARGWDALLARAWEQGAVLSGVSAGALCWFAEGVSDAIPGQLVALPALGLVSASVCVHWDSEPARQPVYRDLIARGAMRPGWALEDGVALHLVGGELHAAVSSRPGARGFRLGRSDGKLVEQPLAPRLLPAP